MARTTGNAKDLITFTRASTGTFLGSNGLLQTAAINTPRVEYDANGVAKGLLIEEARTNLETYSENFSTWGKSNVTVTTDVIAAPDGNSTADKLFATASGAQTRFISGHAAASVESAFSFFIKAGEVTQVLINLSNSGPFIFFDTSTQSFSGANGTISGSYETVGNDWYRVTVVGTAAASANVGIWLAAGGSYNPNLNAGDGVYIWGAQVEAGSFPTSYIPTSGATATRSADIASVSVSEFGYNQAQGSVVVEFSTADISTTNELALSDGTNNNRIMWGLNTAAGRLPYISSGGVNTVALVNNTGIQDGVASKAAIAFAANDVASSLDGQAVATDTSATIPSAITTLYFLGANGVDNQINGHIKSINYYPLRLSDAKLQSLTS